MLHIPRQKIINLMNYRNRNVRRVNLRFRRQGLLVSSTTNALASLLKASNGKPLITANLSCESRVSMPLSLAAAAATSW